MNRITHILVRGVLGMGILLPGGAWAIDLDMDGMPDRWETENGLMVGVDDADEDKDRDGQTNKEEYHNDTDPSDHTSLLALELRVAEGDVHVSWRGGQHAYQDIQVAAGLGQPNTWTNIDTLAPPTPMTNSMVMPIPTDNERGYLRLRTRRYPTPPNIVLIVADDLGWADVGYHGSHIATPNIDQLAADGMQLDRFYTYSVCSRTRSALMTGRSTIRVGTGNKNGLPLPEHTLAETLQAAGYQTWMFGKWHLGGALDNDLPEGPEYHPHNRGFDTWYGHLGGAIDFWGQFNRQTGDLDWWRGAASATNGMATSIAQPGDTNQYSSTLLTSDAISTLRNRNPEEPFFLYLPYNAIHGPTQAPQVFLDRYEGLGLSRKQQQLAACCEAMDHEIGRLLGEVDMLGLRDNTLVLFMSDNGGQLSQGASNLPLNGEKSTCWEGGVRVPAVMRWPTVIPPDSVCRQLCWVGDLFPTLCAAIGVPPQNSKPFDGVNLWPALRYNRPEIRPPMVTGNAQKMVIDESAGPDGPWWKLRIVKVPGGGGARDVYLHDVHADPYETTDLWDDANPDPAYQALHDRLSGFINSFPLEY